MTQFNSLDYYSLLDIFDNLHFNDLLNLADVDATFYSIITDHYMIRKFRICEKVICLNGYVAQLRADAKLSIGALDSILRFLRIYGHQITRLEFDSVLFDSVSAGKISQHIEKYKLCKHINRIRAN